MLNAWFITAVRKAARLVREPLVFVVFVDNAMELDEEFTRGGCPHSRLMRCATSDDEVSLGVGDSDRRTPSSRENCKAEFVFGMDLPRGRRDRLISASSSWVIFV